VADRFGQLQLPAVDVQGPDLAADGAGLSAVGAGLLFPQGLGPPFQQGFQGAFGQAAGGGLGHFLQGREVQIGAVAVAATGAAGHNFSPLVGQFT
jgi:hypothetical protein